VRMSFATAANLTAHCGSAAHVPASPLSAGAAPRRFCGNGHRARVDLGYMLFGIRRAGRTVGPAEEGTSALGDGLALGLVHGVGVVVHPADLPDERGHRGRIQEERGHRGRIQEEEVGAEDVILPGLIAGHESVPDVPGQSTASV